MRHDNRFDRRDMRETLARGDFRGHPGHGHGPGFGPGPGDFMFDGPGRHHGGFRGPGRGRGGDVRNTILALLAEQPMNGYQLMQTINEKTNGLWSPKAGSVYPALGQLQDEGLIEQHESEGKKTNQLTAAGRQYVDEHTDELTEPWARVIGPHEGLLEVRQAMQGLHMALRQVAEVGDEQQREAAIAVLADARRSIYQILAGEGTDESGPAEK